MSYQWREDPPRRRGSSIPSKATVGAGLRRTSCRNQDSGGVEDDSGRGHTRAVDVVIAGSGTAVLPDDEVARTSERDTRNLLQPGGRRPGSRVGDRVLGTDHRVDHNRVGRSVENRGRNRQGHFRRGRPGQRTVELAPRCVLHYQLPHADEAATADRPAPGSATGMWRAPRLDPGADSQIARPRRRPREQEVPLQALVDRRYPLPQTRKQAALGVIEPLGPAARCNSERSTATSDSRRVEAEPGPSKRDRDTTTTELRAVETVARDEHRLVARRRCDMVLNGLDDGSDVDACRTCLLQSRRSGARRCRVAAGVPGRAGQDERGRDDRDDAETLECGEATDYRALRQRSLGSL